MGSAHSRRLAPATCWGHRCSHRGQCVLTASSPGAGVFHSPAPLLARQCITAPALQMRKYVQRFICGHRGNGDTPPGTSWGSRPLRDTVTQPHFLQDSHPEIGPRRAPGQVECPGARRERTWPQEQERGCSGDGGREQSKPGQAHIGSNRTV